MLCDRNYIKLDIGQLAEQLGNWLPECSAQFRDHNNMSHGYRGPKFYNVIKHKRPGTGWIIIPIAIWYRIFKGKLPFGLTKSKYLTLPIQVNLDMTDHCTTDYCIWRTICLVPVRCISSIRHMYTTDFAYDGPIFLVPLSLSYPSSPV